MPTITTRRPSVDSSDSFEVLSPPLSNSSFSALSGAVSSDEDDQIVFELTSSTFIEPISPLSDEEFIVLSPIVDGNRPNSSAATTELITRNSFPVRESSPTPSSDTTTPPASPRRKPRRKAQGSTPRDTTPSDPAAQKKATKRKQKRTESPLDSPQGFTTRSIVDDCSEIGDEQATKLYDEAVRYINCFLSDPMENKAAHLALLQALIIELGFFTSQSRPSSPSLVSHQLSQATPFDISDLPHSMRAAKSFIKANVFINVREYIAVRSQGQEALKSVLHPSRRALMSQLRSKNARLPRNWVKEHGLNVFLVTCH